MQEVCAASVVDGDEAIQSPIFLLIVFPQALEDDLIGLLDTLRVSGFTQSQKVTGRGPRGRHYATAVWPGADSTIFSVVGPDQAVGLSNGLTEFNTRLGANSHGMYGRARVYLGLPTACLASPEKRRRATSNVTGEADAMRERSAPQ
jgi:hypothetical protein